MLAVPTRCDCAVVGHTVSPAQPVPAQGDLARLLETERRLEERLRAARIEAEAVVARAQQSADQEKVAANAQMAEAARRLDERLAAEGRQRAAQIAADADAEVRTYEQVSPARLAAVARALAERFLVGEDAP